MAITREDEILGKAVSSDKSIIPRYKLVKQDGSVVAEHVELQLENPVLQVGMPYDKSFANEILAASGTTKGTLPALELAQKGFQLFAGAVVRVKLHRAIIEGTTNVTLNVENTGALAVFTEDGSRVLPSIGANSIVELAYNSVAWVLMGAFWCVGKAAQLSSWRTIITNLSFGKPLVFDGSQDIAPGVTGILPVANGGTGTNSLANVSVGKAAQLSSWRTIVTNLSYDKPLGFNGTVDIAPGVTGILPVSKGGTGTTTYNAIRYALGLGLDVTKPLPVANGGTGVNSLGNIIAGSAQGLQNTINGVSTNLTWQMHFEQQTLVGTTTADGWLTIGYTKNYRNDFMTAVLTEYQIANANKLITTLNFNQTQWLVAVINPQGGRIPNLTLRVNTIRFRGLDTK